MKHIKQFNLFETIDLHNRIYYHGTSTQSFGEQIIKEGIIKPGNTNINRGSKLTPMIDMTYATPSIETACTYALGGIMMGVKTYETSLKNGQFGFIFEIDSNSFTDIKPDEDFVGELIYFLEKNPNYYTDEMWLNTKKWMNNNPSDVQFFLSLAKSNLTDNQYRKCIRYDDYADFAVAGKKLNKILPNDFMKKIIQLGCPIANKGSLKISNAWKIDKNKSIEIKKDASNFFDIAEKV